MKREEGRGGCLPAHGDEGGRLCVAKGGLFCQGQQVLRNVASAPPRPKVGPDDHGVDFRHESMVRLELHPGPFPVVGHPPGVQVLHHDALVLDRPGWRISGQHLDACQGLGHGDGIETLPSLQLCAKTSMLHAAFITINFLFKWLKLQFDHHCIESYLLF